MGDFDGHPFRGNQYTHGGTGTAASVEKLPSGHWQAVVPHGQALSGGKQRFSSEQEARHFLETKGFKESVPGVTVSRGDYRARAVDNRGMPDRSGRGRSYAERVHEARTRELRSR
jgi:hypothetical protein